MGWKHLSMIALLLPVTACATMPSAVYLVETKGPYQLDTGDTLRITVYGEDGLTNSYKVDDAGAISFPLVGTIKVRGSTTKAASARIASALANGYLRTPDVAVEVAQYRPFFIQGEIANSGQFPYVVGMTVRSAIATAGGYSDTADRNQAVIYRRQGNEMARGNVNLDAPIFPGDTITIAERWF